MVVTFRYKSVLDIVVCLVSHLLLTVQCSKPQLGYVCLYLCLSHVLSSTHSLMLIHCHIDKTDSDKHIYINIYITVGLYNVNILFHKFVTLFYNIFVVYNQ